MQIHGNNIYKQKIHLLIAVKVQDKLQKYVVPFYADNRAVDQTEKKLYGHHAANLMKTDIKELDNGYELEIDLPGFKKDEVKAELNNGYLTVSAAKGLDEDKEDKKTGKYIRRERYAGSMSRSFYVGEGVTQEDIHAKYEHGVLKLSIPKKEEQKKVEKSNYIAIE